MEERIKDSKIQAVNFLEALKDLKLELLTFQDSKTIIPTNKTGVFLVVELYLLKSNLH